MNLRITILQGAFLPVPPLRGGAIEKAFDELGRRWAGAGHAVTHVSRRCDGLPAASVDAGVRHLRVAGSEQPRSLALLKVRDLLYTWRAARRVPDGDIVVTHTFFAPVLLPRRAGRVVVHVGRMPRGQIRWYRRAAALQVPSAAVADAVRLEAPAWADRVVTIPYPVRPAEACGVERTRTVLFAGRLHPEKGVHLLVRAFAESGLAGEGWRLRLVGPHLPEHGGAGAAYREELLRAGASVAVDLPGPVFAPGALEREYAAASVFAYPSLARGETFGLAVLEAMAGGCACVVSSLPCFRDFVRDGANARMFDEREPGASARLAAALREAAATGDAWRQPARATAADHAPGAVAGRFLELFRSLAARGGSSVPRR